MRLEFGYSILAMSFIIGIARSPYLVGSDMSLHSTLLTKRPPYIAGINLFTIVSSIGWKYSWISGIVQRKDVNLLLKPPIKAWYAAWGSVSADLDKEISWSENTVFRPCFPQNLKIPYCKSSFPVHWQILRLPPPPPRPPCVARTNQAYGMEPFWENS